MLKMLEIGCRDEFSDDFIMYKLLYVKKNKFFKIFLSTLLGTSIIPHLCSMFSKVKMYTCLFSGHPHITSITGVSRGLNQPIDQMSKKPHNF